MKYPRYPEYRPSGVEWIGAVPERWGLKPLGGLVRIVGGGTPDKARPDYWAGSIPWVSPKDFTSDWIDFAEDHISEEALRSSATKLIPRGAALVVVRSGILRRTIPVALNRVPVALNQDVKALIPTSSSASVDFLRWFIRGHEDVLLTTCRHQGATVESLEVFSLRKIPVPHPPPPEQVVISAFLDAKTAEIDTLIAKKERLLELLEEKRIARLEALIGGGLRSARRLTTTGSAFFPEIPTGWELKKLRRLVSQVKRPVTVDPGAEYREIGIRSWGRGVFHKDAVRGAQLDEKSVFQVEPGDFVLNIVFAWEGAVAVVTENERGMVGSHRFPTFRCGSELDPEFLLLVFKTERGRALLEMNSPGAAGRNKTLRVHQFLNEFIPVPSAEVQREIVSCIKAETGMAESVSSRLREAIDRLREYRTALISAAVTGKIDVRNLTPTAPCQ